MGAYTGAAAASEGKRCSLQRRPEGRQGSILSFSGARPCSSGGGRRCCSPWPSRRPSVGACRRPVARFAEVGAQLPAAALGPLRRAAAAWWRPCLSGPLAPHFAPAFRFGPGALALLGCSPCAAARRRGGVLDPSAPGSALWRWSARRVVVGAAPRLSPGLRWPPKGHPAIGGRPRRRGAVPPSGGACFPPGCGALRRLSGCSAGRRYHRSAHPSRPKQARRGRGLDS